MDVLEELVRLRRSGERCALATIVEVNGSIPSFESAKMLIRADGTIAGTIGGGCVEAAGCYPPKNPTADLPGKRLLRAH